MRNRVRPRPACARLHRPSTSQLHRRRAEGKRGAETGDALGGAALGPGEHRASSLHRPLHGRLRRAQGRGLEDGVERGRHGGGLERAGPHLVQQREGQRLERPGPRGQHRRHRPAHHHVAALREHVPHRAPPHPHRRYRRCDEALRRRGVDAVPGPHRLGEHQPRPVAVPLAALSRVDRKGVRRRELQQTVRVLDFDDGGVLDVVVDEVDARRDPGPACVRRLDPLANAHLVQPHRPPPLHRHLRVASEASEPSRGGHGADAADALHVGVVVVVGADGVLALGELLAEVLGRVRLAILELLRAACCRGRRCPGSGVAVEHLPHGCGPRARGARGGRQSLALGRDPDPLEALRLGRLRAPRLCVNRQQPSLGVGIWLLVIRRCQALVPVCEYRR
mmetsp:Transcript_33171/g.69458  ORF Transcript_33171/g.69458 Transcript_33171/m.69458 type:complete len:393 (-) Transcript_33171:437-1615(-)